MHSSVDFIQDLAMIMTIAAFVILIFHRFKQPIVLGYIAAGAIIGPFTPNFLEIQGEETVKTLAELGIVFLMFSLGLEFNLRKLFRVGVVACVAAFAEILLMSWLGYTIGQFFGWNSIDSLFLGGMLAISSTTIIVKALKEMRFHEESFSQVVFGILIVEDILAIVILALLSSIAVSGSLSTEEVMGTLSQISAFIIASLIIGILVVPRMLAYVSRSHSHEMLLISTLGICFGFCLIVVQLEYSIALGAFIIGAIVAESEQIAVIDRLTEPLKDMFSAVFFVAVGLLLDPAVVLEYGLPIAVITVAVILGKCISCGAGAFICGYNGKTSLRVGLALSQIGEFSFIIATLGITLGVMQDFLYPIVVAVSAITTLTTPYLIKLAAPLSVSIGKRIPEPIKEISENYMEWVQDRQERGKKSEIKQAVTRGVIQLIVNFILIAGIFSFGKYLFGYCNVTFNLPVDTLKSLVWAALLLLSLPFLVAIYRKTYALAMLFAEMQMKTAKINKKALRKRTVFAQTVALLMMGSVLLAMLGLSQTILPSFYWAVFILVVGLLFTVLFWNKLIKWHARIQVALLERFDVEK